jgi:tRNA1Val (adenine37-N6)-methyltransferase
MFHFKQFSVDQSGCAMKINTDGVLLAALVKADEPISILDLGTGTGVIALMLAQRFNNAMIDAIEIDNTAAQTAANNFIRSAFHKNLNSYHKSFASFFESYTEKKYDLIISNPPFHIHSLKSPGANKSLAKHTDESFFEELIAAVPFHLTKNGSCCLILPLQTSALVKELFKTNNLCLHKIIELYSFIDSEPHREILTFGLEKKKLTEEKFVIYNEPNVYTNAYRNALKNFLTIF